LEIHPELCGAAGDNPAEAYGCHYIAAASQKCLSNPCRRFRYFLHFQLRRE
jgi:hypothetical protein